MIKRYCSGWRWRQQGSRERKFERVGKDDGEIERSGPTAKEGRIRHDAPHGGKVLKPRREDGKPVAVTGLKF